MRAHPTSWLRLLGTKVLLTWNRAELPDTESLEVYADFSPLLRAFSSLFGFAGLFVLGAAGMVLARRLRHPPLLLDLMFFGFSAAVAAFYVFARYRFPIVPILALFGGHALASAVDAWRAGPRRLPPAALLAGAAAAAIAWLPLVPARGSKALAYENLGIGFSEDGRSDPATAFFAKSIDLDPRRAGPHYNLGVALAAAGRVEEAANEFLITLRLDPAHASAHDNLGVLLAGRGNFPDAERHFREAHRLDPSSPLTLVNLGNAALSQGRESEAIDWYRQALAVKPDYNEARLNLVQALARSGLKAEAAAEAREVLRRDPGNVEARDALARLQNL
jgi:tetratricopeptide (TPR) repeat protein